MRILKDLGWWLLIGFFFGVVVFFIVAIILWVVSLAHNDWCKTKAAQNDVTVYYQVCVDKK